MKKLLSLLLILNSLPAFAAEEADPAMAVLKRMREQLRSVMIQQQKTEAERATLQAANVELEDKLKSLDTKFKALAKESNAQKDADAKTIAELKAKIAAQEQQQARLEESLAKWKQGHQQVTDEARKIEAQRAEMAARVILLDRKVADYQRKNDELFKIGSEVLSKYEGFGLGTAIAAREPFTRNMRVKLETLVQDYSDKLVDSKIKPDEAPKTAPQKAAASRAAAAPPSPNNAKR
ncbi:phage major capsid protein [Prosthecobacter sp.]|jgi:chromosome segregation ATPase|uniref:phage major capsid protein n=1 Tax=Prosthecobacter sp. TaxID=1965333 RepID=UPI0037841489